MIHPKFDSGKAKNMMSNILRIPEKAGLENLGQIWCCIIKPFKKSSLVYIYLTATLFIY